jgi:micrococcal nuclease
MRAFIVLISLLPSLVHATEYGSAVVAKIISVYDGDTFRADIANWQAIAGQNIGIRVNGIDTPEIRGKCQQEKELAIQARDIARQVLQDASVVELHHIQRGKYFRLVAVVIADGQNLGDVLIARGLAVPYDGGTKTKDWCQE